MSDTQTPNPADFSRNEREGEYTAHISVRGTIEFHIKANSREDAQRQAEKHLEQIEKEGYVEIDDVEEVDVSYITKDPPMYRVTREGKPMQVSHLHEGDTPRAPDKEYGF